MTTSKGNDLIKFLNEIQLHIFYNSLTGDYTGLERFATDKRDNKYNHFYSIRNLDLLQKKPSSIVFNLVYIPTLLQYIYKTRCKKDIDAVNKVCSEMLTIHFKLNYLNFFLGHLMPMNNYGYVQIAESIPLILETIQCNYGVLVTSETFKEDIIKLHDWAESEMRRYNRLCGELALYQPKHDKDYFLSIIKQTQDMHKLYDPGTAPEEIFNEISIAEFIEYELSLQPKP